MKYEIPTLTLDNCMKKKVQIVQELEENIDKKLLKYRFLEFGQINRRLAEVSRRSVCLNLFLVTLNNLENFEVCDRCGNKT